MMKVTCISLVAICLLVAFVSGAEESADPSIKPDDVKVSNLEQDDHGPLMKAILTPVEGTLNRQKRSFQGKGGGGGTCTTCSNPPPPCNTCGGGGGGEGSTSWSTASASSGSGSGQGSHGKK